MFPCTYPLWWSHKKGFQLIGGYKMLCFPNRFHQHWLLQGIISHRDQRLRATWEWFFFACEQNLSIFPGYKLHYLHPPVYILHIYLQLGGYVSSVTAWCPPQWCWFQCSAGLYVPFCWPIILWRSQCLRNMLGKHTIPLLFIGTAIIPPHTFFLLVIINIFYFLSKPL